jgi:hypothetical protein
VAMPHSLGVYVPRKATYSSVDFLILGLADKFYITMPVGATRTS